MPPNGAKMGRGSMCPIIRSFTEKDDEEAYGKAGPLRKALTKRDGSFTEKDDEEAYGKAGPLREAPYEEERS